MVNQFLMQLLNWNRVRTSHHWEVAPTPQRIREDIMAAESVWQKILAADGIAVPDVAFRHGKRLASKEKKVSSTKHQLQLPVMHHDMRPAMEFFIRRGDDKATDETVDFTLSLLRIAEATVDTKIGDPGDDDPDAEVDAEAQARLQIHEEAAPADDDNENDQGMIIV